MKAPMLVRLHVSMQGKMSVKRWREGAGGKSC